MSISSRWPRGQKISGNEQHFHVQVPIIYQLPSFSPNWEDYSHGENNKTVIMKSDEGQD